MSLLRKFQFKDGSHELEKVESQTDALAGEEQHNLSTREKDALRCVMMELASSFVKGAKEDLIYSIYTFAKDTLQNDDEIAISESYHTLSRILEEHDWFCSSGFAELIYLLLGLRSPVDIISLRSRFASFQSLMIHTLKIDSEVENSKWFLILNEIVLKLKDVQLSGYMTMDLLIIFSVSGYMTMEKAVEIFDELKERCLVYDGVVNSTFMDWFFNWGKEKEAMESYKSLLDRQFRMAPATCNVLLEVLLKYGKKKEAWDLFDQMLDNHTPPNFQAVNSETFTIMVNECFKLGKCDGALTTFTAIGHNLHVYEYF